MSTLPMLAAGSLLVAAADAIAQETPPAPKPRPNAATVYRLAIEAVKPVLRIGSDDEIDLGFEILASELPVPDLYLAEPWSELVVKAAGARTLFAQATRIRDCRFDGTAEPPATELSTLLYTLGRLHLLVAADAWQRVGSDPVATLQVADQLLDHALHIGDDLAHVALLVRLGLEEQAAALFEAAVDRLPDRPASAPALEHALQQLDSHLAARPDARGVADRMLASAQFLLTYAIDEQRRRSPGEASEAMLQEAKALALADFEAAVSSLRAEAPPDVERVEAHFAELAARWQESSTRLDVERGPASGLAKPLAAAICSIFAPNAPAVYRLHLRSTAALEACRAALLARLVRGR